VALTPKLTSVARPESRGEVADLTSRPTSLPRPS
jgi:hypothetical protein